MGVKATINRHLAKKTIEFRLSHFCLVNHFFCSFYLISSSGSNIECVIWVAVDSSSLRLIGFINSNWSAIVVISGKHLGYHPTNICYVGATAFLGLPFIKLQIFYAVRWCFRSTSPHLKVLNYTILITVYWVSFNIDLNYINIIKLNMCCCFFTTCGILCLLAWNNPCSLIGKTPLFLIKFWVREEFWVQISARVICRYRHCDVT